MDISLEQELNNRLDLLAKAANNKDLQALEVELCKEDILHFFRNYLYTDKNTNLFSSDEPSVIPFIPFAFQEELITEVWSSIITGTKPIKERDDLTNVFIEKSRQMGVSWIIMGIFVYGRCFHNHKYHVISQKESDVDKIGDMRSLFEKARFMIDNLPSWMLPQGFSKERESTHNKRLSISRPDSTGAITGESANPNASRSGTYNAVFMDEMAFQDNAATINAAAASATPCRIFNSTPNGEGNEFYRMRKLCQERKGENGEALKPEIKWLRYHWSEHPLYCRYKGDTEWFDWRTQGMTKEKIAQELEIDYNTAIEGRVYAEFGDNNIQFVEYDPVRPLYIRMDNSQSGKDPHAVIIAQTNPDSHHIDIIDCIQLNCSIPDMASFMAGAPKRGLNLYEQQFYDRYMKYNWKRATFVSDPYDSNTNIRNIHHPAGIMISKEYSKLGIHINLPKITEMKTRIMHTRANIYRMRVNERCSDFISSIMNARYQSVSENSSRVTAVDKPEHDWTSHYRTALEYGIARLLENEVKPKVRVALDTRPMRDPRTRKLVYS